MPGVQRGGPPGGAVFFEGIQSANPRYLLGYLGIFIGKRTEIIWSVFLLLSRTHDVRFK